uniref:Uncharacterized protein n=1 Tax=Arundo donax TaxID=35708 RepID=A0A0A9AUQ8_ARUDO
MFLLYKRQNIYWDFPQLQMTTSSPTTSET